MDEADILRNHVLYQTSWIGWPCNHGLPSKPGSRSSVDRRNKSPTRHSVTANDRRFSHTSLVNSRRFSYNSVMVGSSTRLGISIQDLSSAAVATDKSSHVLSWLDNTSSKGSASKSRATYVISSGGIGDVSSQWQPALTERRNLRVSRRKPWKEEVPKLKATKNTTVELHYEKILPKGKWLEYKKREYVTNPRYGHIYELRTKVPPKKESAPAGSTWLWEDEYRIWRLELDRERQEALAGSTSRNVRSSDSKLGRVPKTRRKMTVIPKPHADLFAMYNGYRLVKQRRQNAAIVIQKIVRGWLVRHRIKQLKHQCLLALGQAWPRFVKEYRQLVTRIQSRYGVMRTSCPFDLRQVKEFLERKERYERTFERMSDARVEKLPRDDLPEYFRACGLHPTEGEINAAFSNIFRGSGNTAEVIFVLDCSALLGHINFQCQMLFLKDVISGLDVAPDRVRVGLIPFNEDIIQAFGLTKHATKESLLENIENIDLKSGLTRTDLALKMMREMFQVSRPGVHKMAIIVTDGRFSDIDKTIKEAKKCQQDNIEVYAVGVGRDVNAGDLAAITGSDKRVLAVSSYKTLTSIKDIVRKRVCLLSDQAESDGSPPPVRDACRPLTREEALEVVWTLYPPQAAGIQARKSRWIRPVVGGTEAWSLLDERICHQTDFKTCLKLVIQSRLAREGFVSIPSDLRQGVEEVTDLDEAMAKIDRYLATKKPIV
ncbi:uncharacterized protein LOC121384520 isoform X2 [Gigantopelta aegis]|uniref:uncharacterized protein LOC121384520 isoform X2 n=1 Tax=Gigantopelta aegis TaxID=1735272 RepID=UPI001B88D81C|nr:uncharacterized protein LOC121384520 isoform X2 [Gigantopelta aegis]